MGIIWVVGV